MRRDEPRPRPRRRADGDGGTRADWLDLFAAREAIEYGAAHRVVHAPEPVDVSPLRRAFEQLRAAARDIGQASDAVVATDVSFHEALVRLVGSRRLSRAHAALVAETHRLVRDRAGYPGPDHVARHQRLLEALERRDSRAPELVVDHLRTSVRLLSAEPARARRGRRLHPAAH